MQLSCRPQVGFCFLVSWVSNEVGLSAELGAFLAGVMGSIAEAHALDVAECAGSPRGNSQRAFTALTIPHETIAHSINSIQNVFTALFIASMGLIMSPSFLWAHMSLLTFGTLVVFAAKTAVISSVVAMFRVPIRTSFAVGISLAHIGEFAFVLLAIAKQLQLLALEVRGSLAHMPWLKDADTL